MLNLFSFSSSYAKIKLFENNVFKSGCQKSFGEHSSQFLGRGSCDRVCSSGLNFCFNSKLIFLEQYLYWLEQMPTELEFELSSISKQVQTDHLLNQEANQIFQHLPYQAAHFFSSTNIFSGLLKNLYLKLENLRIIRWVLFQYMKMQKSRVHFFHSNEMILDGIHRRKFGD